MSNFEFSAFFKYDAIESISYIDFIINLCKQKEDEVQIVLDELLSKQCEIESNLYGLSKVVTILPDVTSDANKLDTQIVRTGQLAESVSAKVRRLDLARSRVCQCQQRVHDLIDLKSCSRGVVNAIAEESFEVGAGHINRFLAMDLQLLNKTADDVQGSVSSVREAVNTLETATIEMRELIVLKFDDAARKDDLASVERFFKIFPLLGLHQEGIEKFTNYICYKLSTKAQKELRNSLDIANAENRSPLAFADTLTSLLENFARVIEVNQPIVESCFGSGHLFGMLKILQRQCDSNVRNLLLEFNNSRKIPLRTLQVKERSSRNCTSGSSSAVSLGHRNIPFESVDKLNLKEVDAINEEIIVMHSRAELYIRFMKRRAKADIEASPLDRTLKQGKLDEMNQLLKQSDLSRQMQELLGTYLLLERFFMEESVIKAIALDTYETNQLCSSMVDDVFFILRKAIRRSLSSQSVNGTCAVINNAATCLYSEFFNTLRAPLKQGFPSRYIDLSQAYSAIQSTLQQGRLQSSDNDKCRVRFLVYLNNSDMSTEYIETLWETVNQEIKGTFPTITNVEKQLIESCLAELKAVRDTLKACVDFGMQQLRSSAIIPRLHPWVDNYLNYKHHFSEEELALYEASETFVQFLIVQIDGLLNIFKQNLTPRNIDALISIIATELTLRLERNIKKCTYDRLGGLVLDQEVRVLSAYLASITSWSIRDKLNRLTQIATILNLEKATELNDYWNPDNGSELSTWRLTPTEVQTILALRTDFCMEDIKRLRF